MIRGCCFVHSVPVRISPVAVHGWPSTHAQHEVSGVAQGTTEVGVGRVRQGLEELIVDRHNDRTGLLGES
jgi:hypothetical protein